MVVRTCSQNFSSLAQLKSVKSNRIGQNVQICNPSSGTRAWELTVLNLSSLCSNLKYRRFPSYLPCTLLLIYFHLLPSAGHLTGFSFYSFTFLPCCHLTSFLFEVCVVIMIPILLLLVSKFTKPNVRLVCEER